MSTVPGDKARKGKRSRIVVNVEPEPPPEDRGAGFARWRKKSRARRVGGRRRRLLSVTAVALAAVVLVLFLGGWMWWRSFQSSPEYALALAAEAAEADDRERFETLVDMESVSRSVVPQVIERVRGADDALNITPQVRRQIAQNAQVWLPGVRERVRDVLMAETKAMAERGGARDYPFIVRALALARLGESAKQGTGAGRTASVTYQVNERPVVFGLKGNDGSDDAQPEWKIVSVKSDELAGRVAEQVAKTFPMMGK